MTVTETVTVTVTVTESESETTSGDTDPALDHVPGRERGIKGGLDTDRGAEAQVL